MWPSEQVEFETPALEPMEIANEWNTYFVKYGPTCRKMYAYTFR